MDTQNDFLGEDTLKNTKVWMTTIIAGSLSILWVFGFLWTIQDSTFGQAKGLEENQAAPEGQAETDRNNKPNHTSSWRFLNKRHWR